VPFVLVIVMVFMFGLVTLDPPSVFLTGFLIYAASGPVVQIMKWRRDSVQVESQGSSE